MLEIEDIIKYALLEDSFYGDLTTEILNINGNGEFLLISKENFVLCGIDIFEKVFKFLNDSISVEKIYKDGDFINEKQVIAVVKGSIRDILRGERVALNFIQKLSGIATTTYYFVKEIEGTNCKILDTRKTTPLYRKLEKYAVRVGGGNNHRFSLFDGILIKDNHIKAFGSIEKLLDIAIKNKPFGKEIEIEVSNLDELKIVLNYPIDIVLLDNFKIEDIKKAIKIINGKCKVEVSGGIKLESVKEIAKLGVDYISVGALTHSSRWVDISLELKYFVQ